jgi:signal-transduction protein with cAMP-binding, CBS, and nucleotidyltransferase domain
MPIQDLARDDVVSASPQTPVADVARTLRDRDVGSIVITAEDRPVGIVTDRDLTTRVLAAGVAPDGQAAEDVMSTDLCVVESGAGFYEAARVMSENGVRRLPVCGDDGELEGIITVDDLNELLADEHQQLSKVVRAQRPPY